MTQLFNPDDSHGAPRIPDGPKLSDLCGMAEARAWTDALVRDFPLWRQGRLPWRDLDHACVLYGPPGTGKTTCARAVAASLGLPHIEASFAIWQGAPGGHLGSTIEAMKQTFALAKQHKPCVISIDEIDSIPARSTEGSSTNYFNAFTNAMLTELDTATKVEGVVIIGTCNHPELLDPALVRPGRMDRLIAIHLPNLEELKGILRFHLTPGERSTLDGYCGDLSSVAALCIGFSGADVEQAVRSARRLARAANASLSIAQFDDALDPPAQRLSPRHRRRIALHEAGHAVAAWRLLEPTEMAASIVARGTTAGRVTVKRLPGPRTMHTFEALIVYQLAGRAAEQHVLSDVSDLSGGPSKDSDLALATRFASEAVLTLGFSGERRLLWTGNGTDLTAWREDGPIASEVKRVLDQGYATALSLVASDNDKVDAIAEALLARRVLSHGEIAAIMRGGQIPGSRRSLPPRQQSIPHYPSQLQLPRAAYEPEIVDHPDFLRGLDWEPKPHPDQHPIPAPDPTPRYPAQWPPAWPAARPEARQEFSPHPQPWPIQEPQRPSGYEQQNRVTDQFSERFDPMSYSPPPAQQWGQPQEPHGRAVRIAAANDDRDDETFLEKAKAALWRKRSPRK